jgi:trk system potassium uptake protein TrkA
MTKKQFAVIGLGNLGFYLATSLYKKGHEVLAIDHKPNLIQDIKDYVSQAVVADTTDRKVLEELGLKDMDAVIVCIGSSVNNSILTTLNLSEIGVTNLFAKALSEPHGRILERVGAKKILFPEKDTGIALAERLHSPNMLEYLPFVEGFTIIQMSPPSSFIGKTLLELDLTNRYGVQIVAVKDTQSGKLNIILTGRYLIKAGDSLFILGTNESIEKIRET